MFKSMWEPVNYPTDKKIKKVIINEGQNELYNVPFMNSIISYSPDKKNNLEIGKYKNQYMLINNDNLNYVKIDGATSDIPKYQYFNKYNNDENNVLIDTNTYNKTQNKELYEIKKEEKTESIKTPPNTFPLAWTCYEKNGQWICPMRGDKII